MATYSEIRINYNNARAKASKIEELAAQLRAIAKQDLEGSLNMLSNEWTGDSATAFRSKGEALSKELLETAKLMENTARAIRKTAKNISDAERAAIDIIEARTQLGGGFGGGRGGGSW